MGKEWDIETYTKESLYKIALVILIFLLLFRQCGSDKNFSSDKTIVVKSDTVYVKGNDILIPFPDTVFITKVVTKNVKPQIIYLKDSSQLVKYDTFIEDSLLTGNISTTIQLPNKSLIEQTFSYTPKFPKRILRVDTVKIETTIEITIRNERNILVGVGIGASKNNLSINLGGGFRDKQGRDYFYHFDMLQKSHNFGIQIPLRWR